MLVGIHQFYEKVPNGCYFSEELLEHKNLHNSQEGKLIDQTTTPKVLSQMG